MNRTQPALRMTFYSVWAVTMTALTYVLGAPSLKVLRCQLGRAGYWTLTAALSAGLYALQFDAGPENGGVISFKPLALAFLSLSVLIGVFDEFEEMGFSLTAGAFFTLLINSLIAAGAFALWVFHAGPKWDQTILAAVENVLKPVADLNPHIQINYFDLMLQIPSIVVILWMIALYLAVLLEQRLGAAEGAGPPRPSIRSQLFTMHLPDICVWIFIASLLGAFADFGFHAFEATSVNVMNICMVIFFFQGLAVVAKVFERIRMGALWQALFMILIVVQLFLFVSLLGLLDFWLDFRNRLTKRTKEFNREA